MPFTFLLFLGFVLCAVISPIMAVGVMWALCSERWRYAGRQVGKMGAILAAMSIATYFSLNALLGDAAPVRSISIAIAGGGGFTAGAAGICAWIWLRGRKGPTTAD